MSAVTSEDRKAALAAALETVNAQRAEAEAIKGEQGYIVSFGQLNSYLPFRRNTQTGAVGAFVGQPNKLAHYFARTNAENIAGMLANVAKTKAKELAADILVMPCAIWAARRLELLATLEKVLRDAMEGEAE